MKISLGYSPCPNDTFIFDALVHGRIDCEGLEFDVHLGDVEELNRLAFAGKLDMTKLSYHAFAYLTDAYRLLPAGSALGHNCGPLLIAREPLDAASLSDAPVAIPGRYTTANFLLSLAYPHLRNKQEVLFSDIESGVASGRYRAGLIIHENRFTYADHGLVKLRDLGEYWEETTGFPIPLGGIVLRRTFPEDVYRRVARVLARSVAYARAHPSVSLPYVRAHAQEMDDAVVQAHIGLYVNEFTEDLGAIGRAAVEHLFERARETGVVPQGSGVF
ncbi:MAG: 1,4-dihydroxy-6-naphthoate synthase [Saprospiraceae bacterium]